MPEYAWAACVVHPCTNLPSAYSAGAVMRAFYALCLHARANLLVRVDCWREYARILSALQARTNLRLRRIFVDSRTKDSCS
jgi:hypothetical protein